MDAIEPENTAAPSRAALRTALKAQRNTWLASLAGQQAVAGVERQLGPLLAQLEPLCLGLYWPLPGEFDVPAAWARLVAQADEAPTLALPFAEAGGRMHYRRWDGRGQPAGVDAMGIPAPSGAPAEPDVVLVPCLGFTREGYRLGYGGGYFDRWLADHPGVTAVGLAWSVGECRFEVAPHDQPLAVVLTERELLAP